MKANRKLRWRKTHCSKTEEDTLTGCMSLVCSTWVSRERDAQCFAGSPHLYVAMDDTAQLEVGPAGESRDVGEDDFPRWDKPVSDLRGRDTWNPENATLRCAVTSLSTTSPTNAHLNTYLPVTSTARFGLPRAADRIDQRFRPYETCLLRKKRLRVDAAQSPSYNGENNSAALTFMQRPRVHAGVNGGRDDGTICAQRDAEPPAVILSTTVQTCELLQCMGHQDGRPAALQRRCYSTSLSELSGAPLLFEAVLSAFPFVLPMEEVTPSSAHVPPTGESKPYQTLMTAIENISKVAANLALEMGELRRSGERLARLLPGGIFPSDVDSGERLSRSKGDKRRKRCGENSLASSSEVDNPVITNELWCDCVASVTASIDASTLSVLYEKEAIQLLHQDILDTKFQWWRAVNRRFTRGVQLKTEDAVSLTETRQKCHPSPGELCKHDTEGKHVLPELTIAYRVAKYHSALQRWARCCFCSHLSLAYLAKAEEQLYYVPDEFAELSSQSASCSGDTSFKDFEVDEMLTSNIALRFGVETSENERRGDYGRQKLGYPSTLDIILGASEGLQEIKPIAVDNKKDSGSSEARQLCDLRGATEKRRRIWQWIWEAAGALGFCASSRFLAMQLLDAYLEHGKCTVDTSKTVQVATAAVAAVLLAAASRCHWRNVVDDAFLLFLLRQLELPSTVDDVIRTQADMLRLLPSFLFTRRSPVDYLVCFLSNLRWLPQVLEHGSSVELIRHQKSGCRSISKRLTSAEAYASQEGLFKQRPGVGQRSRSIRFGLQFEEERSPTRGFEAHKHTREVPRWHTLPGKQYSSKVQTSAACAENASSVTARGVTPVLLTSPASPAVTAAKQAVSLFEYWRCTGLLGCLEGLMLRCCSTVVASATLCARVPMSRVLAVLLLEMLEPYSWHRLQCQQATGSGASPVRNSGGIRVGRCSEPEKRSERLNCSVSFSGGNWPAGLLQWYRYVSVSVFRMHFDADLLFWKLLLQPLTNQLLRLPENRPFFVLWRRGAEEWTMLLKRCYRAIRVKEAERTRSFILTPSQRSCVDKQGPHQ